MTTIEVAGIFWGCGMIAGALLLYAFAQFEQPSILHSIVYGLGLALLLVSVSQGWDSIASYNYPLTPQDLRSLFTAEEAERRGRTIFSAFMLLSGAITILASLTIKKAYGNGWILVGGGAICVFGLIEGSYQLNVDWTSTINYFAIALLAQLIVLIVQMSGRFIPALVRRLGALFRHRS